MPDLKGHVGIVTGSNRGIGKRIARRLALAGAQVVINGRSREHAEQTAAEIRDESGIEPLVLPGDVTDPVFCDELVSETVRRFGFVDILVNNAWSGIHIGRVENKPPELFSAALDMAFLPALRLMQGVFPLMKDRGWGRIVNVASLNGVNAHIYTADYNAAKEALRALTRTAAREWFRFGIVANVICPAARTERFDEAYGADADRVAGLIGAKLPPGRLGDPYQDIGGVVAFLSSDEVRFMTGNTLFIDGGAHISGMTWEPVPEEDGGGMAIDQYLRDK